MYLAEALVLERFCPSHPDPVMVSGRRETHWVWTQVIGKWALNKMEIPLGSFGCKDPIGSVVNCVGQRLQSVCTVRRQIRLLIQMLWVVANDNFENKGPVMR